MRKEKVRALREALHKFAASGRFQSALQDMAVFILFLSFIFSLFYFYPEVRWRRVWTTVI